MRPGPLLLALSLGLVLAAPAGARSEALSPGTYVSKITAQGPALNGTWKLKLTTTFAPAGRFQMSRNGAIVVNGVSAITGNKLTLVDQSGKLACKGTQQTGIYTFKLKGKTLTLKTVFDSCAARQVVLTSRPFTKQ